MGRVCERVLLPFSTQNHPLTRAAFKAVAPASGALLTVIDTVFLVFEQVLRYYDQADGVRVYFG